MKFGVSMEIEKSAQKSWLELQAVVDSLSKFVETHEYGTGIEHFTVGLVCIKTKPGYEAWYKQRKPMFRKKQIINSIDGSKLEYKNTYSYDIKLTDEEIDNFIISGKNAIKIFCDRFLDSLSNLDTPSMKKRDFDRIKFKNVIQNFINVEGYA
jgi:hypothetical protein